MAKETVGFIGLGVMGKPMAKNLLKAGYPLVVHSRSRPPVDEVVADGAKAAANPKEVARQADIVVLMLPDSPDVENVVTGPDGVLAGARSGQVIVDMSTISPVVTQDLARKAAAKGVDWLDAPVSGGEMGAINATLSIMVGGKEATFKRVKPIFEALGKTIVHMGDVGAGQITKACNQIVVGGTIWLVGEALTLAAKSGVDPAKVREVLLGGFAQSRIMDWHGQRVLERNFRPGFRLRLHHKDLGIALAAGKEYGVPLLVTALVHEAMGSLKTKGKGDLDHSALVNFIEEMAQAEIRPKNAG